MSAKKQTKTRSRTSSNKANKKVSAPRWILGVVLAIVVATGAFLGYSSFAATNQTATLYCYQGYCYDKPISGPNGTVPQIKIVRKNNNCPYSGSGRRWEYLINGNKGVWQCIR